MIPANYAAIILSAGLSSRLKSFKPLLKIGEPTLIERTINLFQRDEIDIYVVTGFCAAELKGHLNGYPNLTVIDNPEYREGMFSSVKAGLKGLKKSYQAFFILPVDIPLVRPYTVSRLIEESKIQPVKIIYPVFQGKRGHPPLIPSGLIPQILAFSGDGGLKTILEQFDNDAIECEVPDRFISEDVDTPDDYERICQDFQYYDIPSPEECVTIQEMYQVDNSRRLHCAKVAEVALRIGKALTEKGKTIDLELVRASSVLHDIVRNRPQHDIEGGKILKGMGFERVADIVAVHTFLEEQVPNYPLEAAIVYLADKFVQGDKLVSLEERFQTSVRRFAIDPDIEKKIIKRKQRAYEVKKEIEVLIGKPLESVIS
jgi:molybdenum cofactor cytidylyltransferase